MSEEEVKRRRDACIEIINTSNNPLQVETAKMGVQYYNRKLLREEKEND